MPDLRNLIIASATLLLVTSLSMPAASANPGERDGRRGPPPEAFEACADKVDGDICGFSGPRGDAEGTCIVPPRGEESLVCAPAGGPPDSAPRGERDES